MRERINTAFHPQKLRLGPKSKRRLVEWYKNTARFLFKADDAFIRKQY